MSERSCRCCFESGGKIWLPRSAQEDVSAPRGFGLISGAEEEEEREEEEEEVEDAAAGGDDAAGAWSAPLRTAGPHWRDASVAPLGHSHHWLMRRRAHHRRGADSFGFFRISRVPAPALADEPVCTETRLESCGQAAVWFAWSGGRSGEEPCAVRWSEVLSSSLRLRIQLQVHNQCTFIMQLTPPLLFLWLLYVTLCFLCLSPSPLSLSSPPCTHLSSLPHFSPLTPTGRGKHWLWFC